MSRLLVLLTNPQPRPATAAAAAAFSSKARRRAASATESSRCGGGDGEGGGAAGVGSARLRRRLRAQGKQWGRIQQQTGGCGWVRRCECGAGPAHLAAITAASQAKNASALSVLARALRRRSAPLLFALPRRRALPAVSCAPTANDPKEQASREVSTRSAFISGERPRARGREEFYCPRSSGSG